MASISTCLTITPSRQFQKSPNYPSFHNSITRSPKQTSHTISYNNVRNSFPFKIRASTTSFYSPGKVIESDKLSSDVRKRAMDAIDKCVRRVTVGDVASVAGVRLNEAQRALQAIAADTNGFLEVSDEGDVLYVFPKDYRSKLAAKSFRIRTEPYLEKAKSGGEYLIRVTFGTALIASILIVFTAIIAILTSSSEKSERKSSRGRSYSLYKLYPHPADLFRLWDPYYYRRQRGRKEDSGMVFIEPVFSFVFGDGDPNEGIEEQRWKFIGQYIGSLGGVVTAEELAPYLDVETAEKMDDDSYMLPVLLRFDGQPQVDKEGNILYQFPSLQRTAASERNRKEDLRRKFKERVGGADKFFKEKNWKLSKISETEMALVGGLGGLNLFGVIVLGVMLKKTTIEPSGFISFVSRIFPLLQVYAASFFAIPLVRWYFIQQTNAAIEKRNRARELCARALELPDVFLRRKILSARDMSERNVIGQDRIVYTTRKDVAEQEYDTQEWDRRFNDISRSD